MNLSRLIAAADSFSPREYAWANDATDSWAWFRDTIHKLIIRWKEFEGIFIISYAPHRPAMTSLTCPGTFPPAPGTATGGASWRHWGGDGAGWRVPHLTKTCCHQGVGWDLHAAVMGVYFLMQLDDLDWCWQQGCFQTEQQWHTPSGRTRGKPTTFTVS